MDYQKPDLDSSATLPPEAFSRSQNFDFQFLKNKVIPIHHTIVGTLAATATNYGVFWRAPFACTILEIVEVHQTAGTDAGAVELNIEKLTGTQALDAGTAILSTAFSLKATANDDQTGVLSTTLSTLQLAKGDRLAMDDSGTLTDVANVMVVIMVKYY